MDYYGRLSPHAVWHWDFLVFSDSAEAPPDAQPDDKDLFAVDDAAPVPCPITSIVVEDVTGVALICERWHHSVHFVARLSRAMHFVAKVYRPFFEEHRKRIEKNIE